MLARKNIIISWPSVKKLAIRWQMCLRGRSIGYLTPNFASWASVSKMVGSAQAGHIRSELIFKAYANFTSTSNPRQVSLLEEVEGKAMQIVKKCRPGLFGIEGEQLEKNTKFESAGLDSLDVMEMTVAME